METGETEKLGEIGVAQSEKLKVMKMSKGYNWEVVILETDLARLTELTDKMKDLFGEPMLT